MRAPGTNKHNYLNIPELVKAFQNNCTQTTQLFVLCIIIANTTHSMSSDTVQHTRGS